MANTRKNRVAIVLGGTADHIPLIEKLRQHGYYVLLIDYYDNPPAKCFSDKHVKASILKREAVLNIARRERADIVIAACIDQALPIMAYVSNKLSLPCHLSYSQAMKITNKEQMKRTFSLFEVPTSKFLILEKNNLANMEGLTFPLVIKPLDANSSKGVTKLHDRSKIEQAIEYATSVSRSNKFIIEEYANGKEYSADVVIKDKKAHIIMITENIKSKIDPEHFTITQSLFSLKIQKKYEFALKEIAEKIAKSFCLNNITLLIQAIIRNEVVSVIEFSARIGGGSKHHFIKRLTGFDMLDFYLSPLLQKDISYAPGDIGFKYGSVNYIYSQNCTFNKLDGADELKKTGIIADYFSYKTPGMYITSHTTSSDRPAGYLILDNSYRLFRAKQKEANNRIKIFNELGINMKINI